MALGIKLPMDMVRCRNHSGDVGGFAKREVSLKGLCYPALWDIDQCGISEILDDPAIPPHDHIDPP